MRKRKNITRAQDKDAGYSLLEILVVLAIIASFAPPTQPLPMSCLYALMPC